MEPIVVVHETVLMLGDNELLHALATKRAVISPIIASENPRLCDAGIRRKDVLEAILSYRFFESMGLRFSRLIVNLTQTH